MGHVHDLDFTGELPFRGGLIDQEIEKGLSARFWKVTD